MTRPLFELDIENLVDFFQVKLEDRATGTIYNFPLYPDSPPLDIHALVNILARVTIYTFNGWNYDVPILTLALYGADNALLKQAGDDIIKRGLKPWNFYDHYNVKMPDYLDHVDLFDVAPGVSIGLKMYMGRTHAPKMQDLPVSFDKPITPAERVNVSHYCDNDLEGTGILREQLADRLALRVAMSARYGVDLRSKSDAQIAEAVIKSQLSFNPAKRYIAHGYTFMYEPPPYIRFVTKQLQELLHVVCASPFMVSDKEQALAMGRDDELRTGVQIPAAIKGCNIVIGRATYRIGIGGLHSQETSCYYIAGNGRTIKDIDVRSYYASLILSMGMTPQQLGPEFLTIYNDIYTRRLKAKARVSEIDGMQEAMQLKAEISALESERIEQSAISDGNKTTLNGTFGKLFSKYSILYAPELGIRTTITGQLALLMLIEMMELSNIQVASANTDGIVLLIPEGYEEVARSNVKWWERVTGLEMEETDYSAIYSRDVNNYIAITVDGKVKRKGVFAPGGLLSGPQGKHPDKDICADAVVAYLKDGVPLADTITQCRDIRKFLQVRAVKGGAIDLPTATAINDGKYLGKAVRWYISGRPGYIGVAGTGDKVAGSDGATPIMELPSALPLDIDYGYYIEVATDMLRDVGVRT